MADIQTQLSGMLGQAREGFENARAVYHEKGIKFFRIPLIIGLAGSLFVYVSVYKPMVYSQKKRKADISSLRAQAEYASKYDEYRKKMSEYEQSFPGMSKKTDWLVGVIVNACKAEGVVPETTSRQVDTPVSDGEFVIGTVEFTVNVPFKKVGELCARLENNRLFIKVKRVAIRRQEKLGQNVTAQISVATIFAKTASDSGADTAGK